MDPGKPVDRVGKQTREELDLGKPVDRYRKQTQDGLRSELFLEQVYQLLSTEQICSTLLSFYSFSQFNQALTLTSQPQELAASQCHPPCLARCDADGQPDSPAPVPAVLSSSAGSPVAETPSPTHMNELSLFG